MKDVKDYTISELLNDLHKAALEGTEDPDMPVMDYLTKKFC